MRKLGEIIELLKEHDLIESLVDKEGKPIDGGYPEDFVVEEITFDSREVKQGTLFVCKGAYFRPIYLSNSVSQGAVCYISEEAYEEGKGVPGIIVKNVRTAMALMGDMFYDHPSGKLKLAAFTGTKGKTTCTHFMKAVMDNYLESVGKRDAGILSSNIMYDGKREVASINTTPEAMVLQRELYNQVENGIEFCAMEVSSQGLKYERTDGVDFDTAIFLNVSKDHISPKEHSDFDDYYNSKLKIFTQAKAAVIDLDDDHSKETLEFAKQHVSNIVTYSTRDESADLYAFNIEGGIEGQKFTVHSSREDLLKDDFDCSISLMGRFNVSNALAVISASLLMGIPVKNIKEGLKDAKVGGRMEVYKSDDDKIILIVDYAHNELSFNSLLDSVIEEYPERKDNIVAIFGADGGKALDRRQELGSIAGKRVRKAILTADHPGPEPFDDIVKDISGYIEKEGGTYEVCEIRTDAIRKAVLETEEPTVILAMGHGTQANQYYWGKYYPTIPDTESAEVWIGEYNRLQVKKNQE